MTQPNSDTLRIALAQLNAVMGDMSANAARAKEIWQTAKDAGADLVVFPELYINGYPPEDLVLKPAFVETSKVVTERLAAETRDGPGVLIGTVWPDDGKVYNAVAYLEGGKVHSVRYKVDLPNYGVFDEMRVFEPGPMPGPININGIRVGVPICEDIWTEDVTECLEECGAELLIVPNGSPFDINKIDVRMNVAVSRVKETGLPLIYVNRMGGQDELVFDGASFVLDRDAKLLHQLPAWREEIRMTDWTRGDEGWTCQEGERVVVEEDDAAAYTACVLGLRDYVNGNGFPGVVLGLSGGVDSALVAAMSVDALGPERVHCIMLPYRYTSEESLSDAAACANALGVRYDTVAIEQPVVGFLNALGPMFEGTDTGVTEENLQSRSRGTILMAVSNKFGGMVVTTGNKSEMSVGYATLYGDMNGGFNPIKDLYKTEVYRISEWRNANKPVGALGPDGVVIPVNILTKAPTAELCENQTDQDNLPEYDVLDDILLALVEKKEPMVDIVARGHDVETVRKVERLLYIAEYKRRQAAPGVKITSVSFGRDRRYPITNRFRETLG